MSPDLRELYQSVILDHYKKPRNFREVAGARRSAEGHNPLCGDRVSVYLDLEDDVVKDVGFLGSGCAICTASASMMTEQLKGKSSAQAEELFRQFHELVTGPGGESERPSLGKLEVFSGVREFPIRVKCATLPWHTFRSALHGEAKTISTE
jgi:nitrogen fixation protein NifU and related proteins